MNNNSEDIQIRKVEKGHGKKRKKKKLKISTTKTEIIPRKQKIMD